MKPNFEKLPNGLTLVTAKNKYLNSVIALAGVQVGSRHEPDGLHGAAHFVEHTFFKGTKKRPSSKAVSLEIESLGGEHNAMTDKELTAFYVRMSKHDGLVAVDVLHDMLENALFRPADIEKERPVICDEIAMYDNNPDQTVWMTSEAHAFASTGLAHKIAGEVSDITFTPAALKKFYKDYYVPSRTVLVLAGAVDDATYQQAKEKFGSLASRPFKGKLDTTHPTGFKPGVSFVAGQTDRLHLVARFPGVPEQHEDAPALELLGLLFGGFMSSRLFQSIRDDQSLC